MGVWDSIIANAVAGVVVAAFAAVAGIFIGKWFTNRWDEIKAQQARDHAAAAAQQGRDHAAAAEFYRAYGEFFASWKAWDAYTREHRGVPPLSKGTAETLQLLTWVAKAEGALESFLVTLVVEHHLEPRDLKALWCFRTGYKQLRYSVRDDRPLLWWRTWKPNHEEGFRAYQAFKGLATYVAALLVRTQGRRDRPTDEEALDNLNFVTGPPVDNTTDWVAMFEQLKESPEARSRA